jgi:hypothetical protein
MVWCSVAGRRGGLGKADWDQIHCILNIQNPLSMFEKYHCGEDRGEIQIDVFLLCASNMCAGWAATSPSPYFNFNFICYRVSDIVQNQSSRYFYMRILLLGFGCSEDSETATAICMYGYPTDLSSPLLLALFPLSCLYFFTSGGDCLIFFIMS